MAIIKEFKALRYSKKVKDLSKVVSPPYDIILAKEQDALYKRDPYNFVRLDLGKIKHSDTESRNRYTRASEFINEWIARGILESDTKDSIYIYTQKFPYKGKSLTRIGFISLFKLEDEKKSKILPHENTFAKPKLDRLNLTMSIGGNLSPVFSIVGDNNGAILKTLSSSIKNKKPLSKVNFDSSEHKLYAIDDKSVISRLKKLMSSKRVYIADGHHRYAVAENHRKIMKERGLHKASHDYTLMYFAPIEQKGNIVLATHRVIIKKFFNSTDSVLSRLSANFIIDKYYNSKSLLKALESMKGSKNKLGVYFGKNLYYLLTLKNQSDLDKLIHGDSSAQWKRLGVSILHSFILKTILYVQLGDEDIIYTRDPFEAVDLVKKGKGKVAFLLRATELNEIKKIAELGEKMPHKATYFYPKLLSGLLIYKFEFKFLRFYSIIISKKL